MKNIIKLVRNKHVISLLILFTVSIMFCFNFMNSPLFLRGDSLFHLNRIQGLANYFVSPVNFHTFNHQGKAVNLFYPSQLLLVVNIIYNFVHDYIISFKIFIFILVTTGLFNMYYVLYKLKRNVLVSICGSLLFILDNYFIGNIYERLAIGEVQAYVFLPVVVYGVYELFFANYKKWYILPVALALISYSHLLSLMLIFAFVIVAWLVSIFTQKYDVKKWKYIIMCFVITLLLTVVQIVPIMEQTKAYDLYTTWDYPDIGKTAHDIWLLLWWSMNNDFFNFMFGISTLALLIFGLFKFRKFNSFERMLFIMSWALLFLQTKYLPWNLLEMTPIVKVQFLWRFNSFITLFTVISVSGYLFNNDKLSKWNIVLFSIIFVGMNYLQFSAVIHYYQNELPGGPTRVIYHDKQMKKVTLPYSQMDYSNKVQYKNNDLQYNQSRLTYINDHVIKVHENIKDNDYQVSFMSNVSRKQSVNIPVTLYKGANVIVNGKHVKPYVSKRGTLSFDIYQKGNINVKVFNSWTMLARVVQFICLFTWIGLISYIIFNRK